MVGEGNEILCDRCDGELGDNRCVLTKYGAGGHISETIHLCAACCRSLTARDEKIIKEFINMEIIVD